MSPVYADIMLVNVGDECLSKRGFFHASAVRKVKVKMHVDTSLYLMSISPEIQRQLDLPFVELRKIKSANGTIKEFEVVGPLMVKFNNRTATCNAFIFPENMTPILGAIPFYEMDVIIDPQREQLIVNPDHPYGAQLSMK